MIKTPKHTHFVSYYAKYVLTIPRNTTLTYDLLENNKQIKIEKTSLTHCFCHFIMTVKIPVNIYNYFF